MAEPSTDSESSDNPEPGADSEAQHRSPRIVGFESLQITPKRIENRRLAAAMREMMANLVGNTADAEELSEAADALESLAKRFAALPSGATYKGYAEAANAGDAIRENLEQLDFFDHSPLIGLSNPLSPPLHMRHDPDDPERIVGHVTFGPAYEGPPGHVHGGYVAAVFDEFLGATQSLSGTQGMTAHLDVDYRSPTPLGVRLDMFGWVTAREGRKIWARAEIRNGDQVCAESKALFLALREGTFGAMVDERDA